MHNLFVVRIFRGTPGAQYWEEFEFARTGTANVISALMEIQRRPINRQGVEVTPVAWESNCLEEVCGACSMLINSKPRQACTALIESLIEESGSNIITVAPLSKFPLIRDLMVDRSIMFDNLKKVHGWIDADASRAVGPGPKISQDQQQVMYALSQCFTCGCCLEGCPQVNARSKFIGPAAIGQVRLFNIHPTGKMQKSTRLHAMMEEGGVADCGNAQNCAIVCPKKLPLTDAIAAIGRDTTLQAFKDLFSLPERE